MDASEDELLVTSLPQFARELTTVLNSNGETHLAEQVATAKISGRCGCESSFCASFYTGPPPLGAWSDEGTYHCVALPGMIALDVVDNEIRYVEVLDRPEIKMAVESFPIAERSTS